MRGQRRDGGVLREAEERALPRQGLVGGLGGGARAEAGPVDGVVPLGQAMWPVGYWQSVKQIHHFLLSGLCELYSLVCTHFNFLSLGGMHEGALASSD